MRGKKSNREVEIKLQVVDAASARKLLRRLRFRVRRMRVFESNVLYDTVDGALRQDRMLLRVRRVGKTVVLTFKGTPLVGKHKEREELEVDLSDAETFAMILDRLGIEPFFQYEKFRTEYSRPGDEEGIVTLDETPIGTYVELEGAPSWIDRVAAEMGFREKDYITASYARLYYAQVAEGSEAPARMAFGSENRNRVSDSP